MATYNRSQLVQRAINSVLSQSYQNFELIVVDDGSADNTKEIVESFKDLRIQFYKQEKNQGMSVARNRGFDIARGDYIALFDDDDELLPGALDTITVEFGRLKNQGIEAQWIWFGGVDAETQRSSAFVVKEGYISYEDELSGKIQGDFFVVLDGCLLSKEDRFDPKCWGYEHLLWLKLFRKSRAFCISRTLRKNYVEHPGRVSSFENRLKHLPGLIYASKAFLSEYGNDLIRLFPSYYGEELSALGSYQLLAGEKGMGRRNLLISFKYRFSPKYYLVFLSSFVLNKEQIAFLMTKSLKLRRRPKKPVTK